MIKNIDNSDNLNIDLYICAKQISQELLKAENISVGDELVYKENDIETTIYLDDKRLVKKPGFQIFAFHIDDLNFIKKNNFIYMNIERDNKNYSFFIGAIYDKLE